MKSSKPLLEEIIKNFMAQPSVEESIDFGNVGIDFMSNGAFFYKFDNRHINWCHSVGEVADKRRIDTRTAERKSINSHQKENALHIEVTYSENDLLLKQNFILEKNNNYFVISATIVDTLKETETNFIAPLDFAYPDRKCDPLFLSLEQKMLLVPYDNDMWVQYESTPLRPGRTSYEVTAIYNDDDLSGMVVGAIDFDDWKNAIRCSTWDARCYTAFSGVADSCTHDYYPHGTLTGKQVTSARFICGWYDDIRSGLEEYGRLAMTDKFKFKWAHGVPFGWNSFSALSISLTLDHWKQTADFIKDELPSFHSADNAVYINLDATFGLDETKMAEIIDHCHQQGQKAGSYLAPLCAHELIGFMPLRGSSDKTRKDIILKKANGQKYPTIDGSIPLDITHPEAELDLRLSIRDLIDKGFDYIKLDFLSHGAVEGKRFDPTIRTGRQALKRFYEILSEELDPEKVGRDIFVSLSIAPLFPAGYGHSRRCCCDAFGHHEDVKYVLNALNFGWWTNGTLYSYNDPDHTVLCHSMVDGRGLTDENSARSRYNASVISGTVMLLSDNFGPTGDEKVIEKSFKRAKLFANNEEINAIARIGKAFIPAYLTGDTCNIYFLEHKDNHYLALFNFAGEKRTVSVESQTVKGPDQGTAFNLNRNSSFIYDHVISIELDAYDSAILKLVAG